MKRSVLAGLIASTAALTTISIAPMLVAHAEASANSAISVKPGMWRWEQETKILGLFSSEEDNLECLIPEKAKITLSRLAADLDEGCHVENVAEASQGYTFRLICRGDVSGKANAQISHSPESMVIRAKGSARWGIISAGLSMKADATYVGECPADEYQRQKEKWDAEQAQNAAR